MSFASGQERVSQDRITNLKTYLKNYTEVLKFYGSVGYRPVWKGKESLYRSILSIAYLHGLSPDDYALQPGLEGLDKDVVITDRLISLAKAVYAGTIQPEQVFKTWNCPRKKDQVLTKFSGVMKITSPDEFYSIFSPSYYQYSLLVKKLAEYDTLARNFNQRTVRFKKPLKLGDRNQDIRYIREYLHAVGDLKTLDSSDGDVFDTYLEEGVKSFQLRHGLTPDGIIGRKTMEEINYPLRERVKDIIVNLEKIRWINQEQYPDRIEINVPSFSLDVYTDDSHAFTMRVIVGKGDQKDLRPTYIHCGRVSKVIFNPYWYVPENIAVKDILPKVRKNPGFLVKNGFKVFYDGREVSPYSVNWYRVNEKNFNYRLVQVPGEKNALGKVKIDFDSPFDIYLHDTPYRELFEKERRDLSSGCIRLEDGKLLAKTILMKDGHHESNIETLYQNKKTVQVGVKSNFMVYILYLTAVVKEDKVYFYRDIYGYDKILKYKLFKR